MTEYSMTEWPDVYLIGIEKIDEQHKILEKTNE